MPPRKKMLILRGINRNSNISKIEVPFCAELSFDGK